MGKVRFGMIGCGGAAIPVGIALAVLPNTTLTHVYDVDMTLARQTAEQFSAVAVAGLDELLGSDVDAVYIAVPHYLLAGLARRVLDAGKHALVEKPMALAPDEIDELTALAASKHLALGVFYELRYSPAFAKARELVQEGRLGEIIGVQCVILIDKAPYYWQAGYAQRSVSSWRGEQAKAGGGVVLMNGSHFIDGLWYVTGLNVVRVQAEIDTCVARVEVEDIAAATLRFENGAVGSLFAGAHFAGSGGDERFTLYGTQGTLRAADPYRNGSYQLFLREAWSGLAANTWHTLPLDITNSYEGALKAFAEAVQNQRPAPVGGSDARRTLNTVLALYRSAREERPIEIPMEVMHAAN